MKKITHRFGCRLWLLPLGSRLFFFLLIVIIIVVVIVVVVVVLILVIVVLQEGAQHRGSVGDASSQTRRNRYGMQ